MADADKSLKTSIETDARQAIAEQERYNAALQAMAERGDEAARSARDLADAEAYRALKAEVALAADAKAQAAAAEAAAQKEALAREQAVINAELQQTVKTVGAADVAAATAGVAATSRWTASKHDLRAALRGLGMQFPMLGRAAMLVTNPIAAAVAGLVGAFTLWRARMKDAHDTLVGFQTAFDPKALNVEEMGRAADAADDYATALRKIITEYNSVESASDRAIERINAEAEAVNRVLAARKQAEIAAARTPEERADIEARHDADRGTRDQRRRAAILAEQERARRNLEREAASRLAAAGAMKPMTEARERAYMGVLDTDAEAAQVEVDKRDRRLADLDEFSRRGYWGRVNPLSMVNWRTAFRYGAAISPGERAAEQRARDIAQGAIDRRDAFAAKAGARQAEREQQAALRAGAVTAGQAAMRLGTDIGAGRADMAREARTDRDVRLWEELARLRKLDVEQDRQTVELQKTISAEHTRTGEINLALAEELRRLRELNQRLEARMAALSTNGAFN